VGWFRPRNPPSRNPTDLGPQKISLWDPGLLRPSRTPLGCRRTRPERRRAPKTSESHRQSSERLRQTSSGAQGSSLISLPWDYSATLNGSGSQKCSAGSPCSRPSRKEAFELKTATGSRPRAKGWQASSGGGRSRNLFPEGSEGGRNPRKGRFGGALGPPLGPPEVATSNTWQQYKVLGCEKASTDKRMFSWGGSGNRAR